MFYAPRVTEFNLSTFGVIIQALSGISELLRLFKFYSYLRDRVPHVPLSPEEKQIASGEIELSSSKLAEFTQRHDAHQQSLKNAFARQQEKAAVSSTFFHVVVFFLPLYLGTLEPGKIRRATNQVDCRLRPTIRRGRET